MPFSITKISNECGVIDNPNINFNVTVANSNNNLKLVTPFGLEKTLCIGTKHDLKLIKNGVFADGTKFYLDYVNENGYVLAQNVGEFIDDKLTWTCQLLMIILQEKLLFICKFIQALPM
jgi:prophage maintenance system killer protein